MTALPTVCFLTGTLDAFAGAERMTAVIANGLAERGYRVQILSLYGRNSVFTLRSDVVHHALFDKRPSFKRAYLATTLGIRRFVRTHDVDVLVEVDTMLTLFTLPATLGTKVKRVAWEHCHFDEDLGRQARRFARWLAAHANDGIVVLTERDRQRWTVALRPRCPVTRIPNPLPEPFPHACASRLSKEVLAVGRLTAAKGFDILLRAWRDVLDRHPDWTLRIVGSGEDRPALEALRDALGIRHSVTLTAPHPELARTYAGAAIFCLSSRYEGYGLVLIEAMAHGLPVVSTACEAGPREFLVNGVNALTVPVDDPRALASSIVTLIEDPALSSRLGATGRAWARDTTIDQVVPLWERTLSTGENDTLKAHRPWWRG